MHSQSNSEFLDFVLVCALWVWTFWLAYLQNKHFDRIRHAVRSRQWRAMLSGGEEALGIWSNALTSRTALWLWDSAWRGPTRSAANMRENEPIKVTKTLGNNSMTWSWQKATNCSWFNCSSFRCRTPWIECECPQIVEACDFSPNAGDDVIQIQHRGEQFRLLIDPNCPNPYLETHAYIYDKISLLTAYRLHEIPFG